MAYRIAQFGDLVITDITSLPENGSNDMGSGDALTSFSQLPGGGFFDNYGAADSPQGIRPIVRNCLLWGDTAEELVENLKAIRAKIGTRNVLTIEFDTGERWWQWARLQQVQMPRPQSAKGSFLPCNLKWVTASQQWYGLVQSGDSWAIGDDSFYLGDGAVTLGMNDYSFDLDFPNDDITVTLPNGGNTFVRNMRIAVAGDSNLLYIEIDCAQTGSRLSWSNFSPPDQWTLTIDTGAKSCLLREDSGGKTISTISVLGSKVVLSTSSVHGLSEGDSVEILGTNSFDGIYHDIHVEHSQAFHFSINPELFLRENETTGTVYPVSNARADLVIQDRKNWFLLAAGDNDINVISEGDSGTQLQDYLIQFRWYEHFK